MLFPSGSRLADTSKAEDAGLAPKESASETLCRWAVMADSAKGFVFLSPFSWWSSVVEALGLRNATSPGCFCPASLWFLVLSLDFSAVFGFGSPAAWTALEDPRAWADALFVSCVEFFGGLLLILGLASRLTWLESTGNMLVAYLTADREAMLLLFGNPGKFYGADPYTFLFAAVLILIFGPGRIALDTWIARSYSARGPEGAKGRDQIVGEKSPASHGESFAGRAQS
jgi:uncharacterized membrane protein YphA (DoxX/SURF4 family)